MRPELLIVFSVGLIIVCCMAHIFFT
jgi:hypothetical protein